MGDFRLFLAGSVDPTTDAFVRQRGYPRLLSYGYQEGDVEAYCKAKRDGTYKGMLMVDSGAFSVFKSGHTINIDDYIAFINAHPEADRYVELDFIPGVFGGDRTPEQALEGAQKSYENYLYMIGKVKEPWKIMPVYHAGESPETLRRLVETKYDGEHYVRSMCISGFKGSGKAMALEKFLADCFGVIKASANPNVEVHALGIGVLDALEGQPLFSSDFASWVMAGAVGTIMTAKFGTLSVSDRGDPKSVVNMSNEARNNLSEYAKQWGFTLEQLVADYRARWQFNATQVQKLAEAVEHRPKPKRIGLF